MPTPFLAARPREGGPDGWFEGEAPASPDRRETTTESAMCHTVQNERVTFVPFGTFEPAAGLLLRTTRPGR